MKSFRLGLIKKMYVLSDIRIEADSPESAIAILNRMINDCDITISDIDWFDETHSEIDSLEFTGDIYEV